MSFIEILIIAVAVAMDAFAVSIASGIAIHRMKIRHSLLIGGFFGFFQGLMPVLGWLGGESIEEIIEQWDHWLAFGLLVAVGIKMIYEAWLAKEKSPDYDPLNIYWLFTLSIATSIDALAVGLTLSFVDSGIIFPILVIGAVTFVMSFVGTHVGSAFGHLLERKMEVVAGIILIGIGIKILFDHIA
jgi:putative Mn2+ efflux pump MntP